MMILQLVMAAVSVASVTAIRDSYPHLSPDGKQLIFHSSRSGTQLLWIASGDGSNPRILYDGGKFGTMLSSPVWSPDGTRIAFAMQPAGSAEGESDIYLMRADGSGARRLTSALGDDSHPHWSADGARIFFNSARATPDPKADWGRQWHDIYSMAADGSDVRRHTDCKTVCTYPVPSPDGRFIAHRKVIDAPGLQWALDPGPRNSDVFVTAIDGSSSVNVSQSPAFDGWPMWSPDGKWLIFASNRDKIASTGQIYAVRPDGSGVHALTSGPLSRVQPSFSPDGKRILASETIGNVDYEVGHIVQFDIDLPD